jgi:hypothetical protein
MVLITGGIDTKGRDISRAMDMPTVIKPFDEVTLMAAIASAVSSANASGEHHAR